MSVRRKTENRLNLIRTCGTCDRVFPTTASSPWIRQVPRDGKKQATTYFCSGSCKRASYKHLFDGKAEERKKQREAGRDISTKNSRYYAAHAEQERARARMKYWSNPEAARADLVYSRCKRKALELEVQAG